ncbi:hypothetical protein [Cystobacter ferrugineus]|uniref:Uncharacterized protein n=1 Tax=Cystobacter ferrugineus TaxID=83449 RepID=A0A1L9B1J2_9BACT|nr:hypothetical protein [Cystobacter ferrugineus]OJH36053.1 hypothetical protein BON30_36290 [Cystobacter ferrugineus]
MKAPLSPKVHGYGDYFVVVLFALAPSLFGFSGLPVVLCYVLAMMHLCMSLLTAYPLGVARLIPFPVHGTVEAVVAIALLAAPFLFGFSTVVTAHNFFIISAIGLFLVWLGTDYKAAERPMRGMGPRRHARV